METADPLPAPRRSPGWLARVLVESVLIVFSVLVALALDEWRDQRAVAARSRDAVAAIVSEINANKRIAQSAKEYHEKVHEDLKAIASGTMTVGELKRGMFQPAVLVQTAWDTARDTGALAPLPLDVVLRLSRVYEWQAKYVDLSSHITNDTYVDLRRRGLETVLRESVPGFGALTSDFSNREASLISRYDEALKLLDSLN